MSEETPKPPESVDPPSTTESDDTPKAAPGPLRSRLLTVFVVLGLLGILSVEFLADDVVAWSLSSIVADESGARIRVEDADASLFRQKLSLEEMDIAIGGDLEEPLLSAENARVSIDVIELLSGRVHIGEVTLEGGLLRVVRDREGRLNIDPGTPPEDVLPDPDEEPAESFPLEGRNLVQEIGDLIERFRTYHEYYQKLRDENAEESDPEEEGRRMYRRRPSWLPEREETEKARFLLSKIAMENGALQSLDKKTGKPFLPDFENVSFRILNITDRPELQPEGLRVELEGLPRDSGPWKLQYFAEHGDAVHGSLDLSLEGLPLDSVLPLFAGSLPFDLNGGTVELASVSRDAAERDPSATLPRAPMEIGLRHLHGALALTIQGMNLNPAGSDEILGLPSPTFTQLFNYASPDSLQLVFSLDGRPSRPKIRLLNRRELLEGLRDRASQAAEETLRALAAEVTQKLDEELSALQANVEKEIDAATQQGKELIEGQLDQVESGVHGALDNVDAEMNKHLKGTPLEGASKNATNKARAKADEILDDPRKRLDKGSKKLDKKVDELLGKPDKATEKVEEALDKGLSGLFGGKKKRDEKKDEKKDDKKKVDAKKKPGKKTGANKKEGDKSGGGGSDR